MPIVRISLREGKSHAYRRAIADSVHRALVETLDVTFLDRFQVIAEHPSEGRIRDPACLDLSGTDELVCVQILLASGRSTEQTHALCARVVELLEESPGMRPQDILMSLVEVDPERWWLTTGEES